MQKKNIERNHLTEKYDFITGTIIRIIEYSGGKDDASLKPCSEQNCGGGQTRLNTPAADHEI